MWTSDYYTDVKGHTNVVAYPNEYMLLLLFGSHVLYTAVCDITIDDLYIIATSLNSPHIGNASLFYMVDRFIYRYAISYIAE